jgi:hypothetical protein
MDRQGTCEIPQARHVVDTGQSERPGDQWLQARKASSNFREREERTQTRDVAVDPVSETNKRTGMRVWEVVAPS